MYATKNDIARDKREAIIALLQARLSDGIDVLMQAKQAHWNVKGPNFIALHELFDQIHAELDGHVDTLAERLVALGGQAYGTVRSAAAASSVDEYPQDISCGQDHVDAFSSALADFGSKMRAGIDASEEIGDVNTADILTGISNDLDKSLWFVEAHLDGSA